MLWQGCSCLSVCLSSSWPAVCLHVGSSLTSLPNSPACRMLGLAKPKQNLLTLCVVIQASFKVKDLLYGFTNTPGTMSMWSGQVVWPLGTSLSAILLSFTHMAFLFVWRGLLQVETCELSACCAHYCLLTTFLTEYDFFVVKNCVCPVISCSTHHIICTMIILEKNVLKHFKVLFSRSRIISVNKLPSWIFFYYSQKFGGVYLIASNLLWLAGNLPFIKSVCPTLYIPISFLSTWADIRTIFTRV